MGDTHNHTRTVLNVEVPAYKYAAPKNVDCWSAHCYTLADGKKVNILTWPLKDSNLSILQLHYFIVDKLHSFMVDSFMVDKFYCSVSNIS